MLLYNTIVDGQITIRGEPDRHEYIYLLSSTRKLGSVQEIPLIKVCNRFDVVVQSVVMSLSSYL